MRAGHPCQCLCHCPYVRLTVTVYEKNFGRPCGAIFQNSGEGEHEGCVSREEGGGVGTQKSVYQKWRDKIFPVVNFLCSHNGQLGLEGRGVTPLPLRCTAILILPWGTRLGLPGHHVCKCNGWIEWHSLSLSEPF